METSLAFVPAQCQFQWPDAARRKLAGRSYLEMAHDIVGIPYEEIAPNFFPTEEETAFANGIRKKLGPQVIAWVLTGTRLDKIYPFTPMAIARLIYELGADVVMIGHPEKDKDLADVVNSHVLRQNGSTKGLHFARAADPAKPAWPLRDVLAMVQHCDLVIGPDTGPMWAVAMREMPKIMLVSHASDENITKHWLKTVTLHADQGRVPCWPCHKLHDVKETCVQNADNNGAACISDISTEAIMETAKRCFQGKIEYRSMTTEEALKPLVVPPVVKGPWPDAEEDDEETSISLGERTHYAG
jgi:ADP-heptose:LPS heptosyltransferase